MKFERKKVALALAHILGIGGAVIIAGTPAQAQDIKIDVTGSSIKRVEAAGALPVDIITREEIARSGVTNTEQLLQSISAVSTSNAVMLATGAGTSTYGLSSVSLRGLGGFRTLVLVNGRRIAPFAGGGGGSVNVNAIPLAAIERVEVLKDGASAVYGSDAIGGVINFILTKDFHGLDVSATYGQPTRSGGGEGHKASAVVGWGDLNKDRYNITLSASFEEEQPLFARDREFARTGNRPPFFTAGATGQGNIEGAFNPGTGSAAAGTWVPGTRVAGFGASPGSGFGNPLAATDQCGLVNMFLNLKKTTKGAPFCAFDSAAFVGLVPARDAKNVSANFVYKVNDKVELFGDGIYSESTVTQRIQPSPIRRSFLTSDNLFLQQGVDPVLLIFPTNPNYKIAADYLNANGFGSLVGKPLAITARVFDFGPRTQEDRAAQSRFVGGVRGVVWNQDYEVAFTHNESKISGTVPVGYFSQVAYARIVQTSNDWNPWSLQQTAAFNAKLPAAVYNDGTLNGLSKGDSLDGKLTGELYQLPAGPLQYAAGFVLRKESFRQTPSPALGTGDIAGLGGATPPVDRDRRANAVYGELAIPVVNTLEATAAMRGDHYNDVGNSTTYKASLRWQPNQMLLMRASQGTGFRAPTLPDLWQPQVVGTSAQFTDPFTKQANLQVPQLSGGNPDLKPETSRQQQIGIVLAPIPSLSIGVDYFRIKLKDIITTPTAQEVVSQFRKGDPSFRNLVTLSPSGDVDEIKVISSNTGGASIAGFDVEANYRQKFSFGDLILSFNGTYTAKYDQVSPGGLLSHKVGTLVDSNCDPVLDADSGGVILRWKHLLSATWLQGPWAMTLAQNWYNGYQTGCRQVDDVQNFTGSQAIYDARVAYTGVKNLTLALGARNIFDKNPPIFVPVSNQFQAGYDINQYDPRARFVYFTGNYRF